MHTAESEFSNLMTEYLGEIITEFGQNRLACLSGAQMGSNHEKIEIENVVTQSLAKSDGPQHRRRMEKEAKANRRRCFLGENCRAHASIQTV